MLIQERDHKRVHAESGRLGNKIRMSGEGVGAEYEQSMLSIVCVILWAVTGRSCRLCGD